jgi:hypothetical protein
MIIKEKSGGKRKDFRIRSKKFLLTYPQVLDLPDLQAMAKDPDFMHAPSYFPI